MASFLHLDSPVDRTLHQEVNIRMQDFKVSRDILDRSQDLVDYKHTQDLVDYKHTNLHQQQAMHEKGLQSKFRAT